MGSVTQVQNWDEVPRSLREGAVLLEINGELQGDAGRGLARLAALEVPVVSALSGEGDATLLAVALVSAYCTASPSLRVDCNSVRLLLELGLPWRTLQRGCQSLLFAGRLPGEQLAARGFVQLSTDAREVAERLASDSASALLVRSLRSAARSDAAQAAAYDRELLKLL